jgi:protein-L-isoaspartate O-methyltransferase
MKVATPNKRSNTLLKPALNNSNPHRPSSSGRPFRPRHAPQPHQPKPSPSVHGSYGDTSWEKSATWYDQLIGEKGSSLYQSLVLPSALKLLNPQANENILDIGCGQGIFTRELSKRAQSITGIDAAPTLIEKARQYPSQHPIRYEVRDAASINDLGSFHAISAILCLQNMAHLDTVTASMSAQLKPGGRMLWVLNHPAFRIPRQSSWGFEGGHKLQYRRIDRYSSNLEVPILMHPGKADSESTVSYHRSLSNLFKPAFSNGFLLQALEEWHSPKQSQPGPRANAENIARKEFPLFIGLLWHKPLKV